MVTVLAVLAVVAVIARPAVLAYQIVEQKAGYCWAVLAEYDLGVVLLHIDLDLREMLESMHIVGGLA